MDGTYSEIACIRSLRRSCLLIISIASLCAVPSLHASDDPYELHFSSPPTHPQRISRFPELSGLGVRCIGEDNEGCMWFGVEDGVVKYDGLTWEHFGADCGLTGTPATSIATRRSGDLVAATNSGIFQYDGGRWIPISPKLPLTAFIETTNGSLWACSPLGLLRLDGEDSTLFTSTDRLDAIQDLPDVCDVQTFPQGVVPLDPGDDATHVENAATHSVMQDSQGRIWAGLRSGTVLRSGDGGASWNRVADLRTGKLPQPFETADGEIWVVSAQRNKGLYRFDGVEWQASKLSMLTGSNYTSAICQTTDKTIWVSGLNRLHVFRSGSLTTHDTRDLGVPGDSYRFHVAADGALWIAGVDGDVVRIAISPDEFWTADALRYGTTEPSGVEWLIDTFD